MVGWFALNVPSGLSLYYFSNTVLTSAQQIFLRKLGGAQAAVNDLGPIELGKARRTGTVAASSDEESATEEGVGAAPAVVFASPSEDAAVSPASSPQEIESVVAPVMAINRRCKRKKRELVAVDAS